MRQQTRRTSKRRRVTEEHTETQEEATVAKKAKQVTLPETGLKTLEDGINELHKFLEGKSTNNPLFTAADYIKLYTTIYNLCTQKPPHDYSSQLYDKYKEAFEEYIDSTVLPFLMDKPSMLFLKELLRSWRNHKTKIRWLSRFFHYLDRYYIARRCIPTLNEVGVICFRCKVYEILKHRARDAMLIMIDQEREGEHIDRVLLKNVVDIFIELSMEKDNKLDLYEMDFEEPLLCNTANYYAQKASKHIEVDSCPQYMLMAEKCLIREKELATSCLHKNSEGKVLKKTQHELLFLQSNKLLEKENTGLHILLRDGEVEHLSRMYSLFSKIDGGLEPVAEIFEKHITEEGLTLVKFAADAATEKKVEGQDTARVQEQLFMRRLIELHDRFMGYVNSCFKGHNLFHKALQEAFMVFCNKDVAGNTSPEILSIFADNLLKKGGGTEKLSDDAIEETLDKIVALLTYIHEKDLFAEFCRKKLARRLLFDRSADIEHERSLLTKLKQQWSAQFTSKMEGMVTDLTLARETQQNFKNYLQKNPHENPGIDISFTVLTTGFWPNHKSSDLQLPLEMATGVEVFKKYYTTKTKHRKLNVVYSLGTCILSARFKPKPIELVVSTYQAATLLLFNDSEKLSYKEIVSQLNLAEEDVSRLLHSLSCAKYKILNKDPSSRPVSKNDSFEFNSMFTDMMRRIKVPLPPADEKKKVMEDVDKDRRYTIDAAVVRIMKSRKVLNFQQLSLECVQQLNHLFKPDFRLIKKRIEDLIQRDYLERDNDNPSTIKYIA